ncbi:hypothetical protein C5B96_13150 [Subtercola sp. Z020]|uniref:hypothetical protein n=1 Tax=Subtercola sp. Z020 TaxID=2080582 RepID=UPI000CE79F14|nr:hypothetical protein [Subtercola sp. Z020]PPF79337.1 hypothetical protein C5B96_13150 [Subtercola sp. Z020]
MAERRQPRAERALSAAASTSLLRGRSRAGLLLLPAAVPFALIPRFSARSPRHVVVALSALPFVGAAAWRSWAEA